MANLPSFPLLLTINGDGVSLSANVALPLTPTGISLVSAFNALGADVSSNISVAVSGSNAVFTFITAFTGAISIALSLADGTYSSPQFQPVTQTTSPWIVGGTVSISNFPATQPVSGTIAVSNFPALQTIQGDSASSAAKAGNPVQIGGVFNTTQPTVTTGQTVEAQSTARGAIIVATGVDAFNIGTVSTVTAVTAITNALPAGANIIGKIDVLGNAGAILDGVITAATAPANGLATLRVYNSTIPVLTTGQSAAQQCDTTGAAYVNSEGRKATYRASAVFTPVAGDIAVLPGSATKTIRVTRVAISLNTTGTTASINASLVKRSTADTSGTHANMTAVPLDSTYAAASSVPLQYTAAPTLGTAVGAVSTLTLLDPVSSGNQAQASPVVLWSFGTGAGNSTIVLRGVAQQVCVNLSAVVATQTVTVDFEWTEE